MSHCHRRLDRARRFGASAEKGDYQANLFDEAEGSVCEAGEVSDVDEAEAVIEVAAHTKRRPKRAPLSKDLPRVVVNHDLADERFTGHDSVHKFGIRSAMPLRI